MNKYIVNKKHKTANYFGASVVTAAVLLTTPILLSAESTVLENVEVETNQNINYGETYKVNKSSSSKVTQDLIDTPQTIQVITKKVMEEQKATTLQEALRNTPGITLLLGEQGNTDAKNNISMRGFDVNSSIYKDGIKNLNAATNDMFNTEAVEVTKGTVGADNGSSVASGYINQISKFATNKDAGEVSGSYGTAQNKRLTADLNKALSETSGVRLNVMKQDGEVAGRDEVKIDRMGIAGAVSFGIGTNTRTSINYERYEQDDVPDGGIPVIGLDTYYNTGWTRASNGTTSYNASTAALANGAKVDSSNFYGTADDYEKVTTDVFTGKIEHDFNDKTSLTNTLRYGKSKIDSLLTQSATISANNSTNPSDWTATRSGQARWQENEILSNATNVKTSFNTASLVHNVSSGFDITIENQKTKARTVNGTYPAANLYNPDYSQRATNLSLDETGAKNFGETKTIGAYAFDSINIGEKFMVIGGGRLDKFETTTDTTTIATATNPGGGVPVGTKIATDLENSGTLKSYKLGFVYKPLENGSVYISYADSQLPPGAANFTLNSSAINQANSDMDPQEANTVELGTKWDFLNNRLSFTSAIYKTINENEVINLGDSTNTDYQQIGEREVKGIELGVAGQITDAWSVTAGIAKTMTEITKGSKSTAYDQQTGAAYIIDTTGTTLPYTPEWTATLWSSYNITKELTLGGGARYIGEMLSGSTEEQVRSTNNRILSVDSYLIYDAMASYKISKNLTTQLNVYNITDEEYAASVNKNGNRYTPGASRSGLLSLAYKF